MNNVTMACVRLAIATGLSLVMGGDRSAPAEAARPSQKQAMAACRAKYGNDVTSVVVKKNGQIVCQEGPGREATRKEVFEWCKKKFSATTIVMQKKGDHWQCLYYGRY